MKRALTALVVAASLCASQATAQSIIINELNLQGASAVPALQGDYIEFWNTSSTPIDMAGYVVGMWGGDGTVANPPTLTNVTIPAGAGGEQIVYGNCFWVFQEGGTAGAAITDPNIPVGTRGMRMGVVTPWAATTNAGCRLMDNIGNGIDYVYLRRGTTALPAVAPNLPANLTWVLGNIGTTAFSQGHLVRLTNTNNHSYADWVQGNSNTAATIGAPNTTLGASQTSIGACVVPQVPWQVNQAGSAFDVNGVQSTAYTHNSSNVGFTACAAGTANVNLASVNVGYPFDVAVAFSQAVSGLAGGFYTAANQVANVNLADPTFFFLNGFTFTTAFPGNFTFGVGIQNLGDISGEMIVLDPVNPDGFSLSQAATIHGVFNATGVAGPASDDTWVTVDFANPALCAGFTSFPFFGVSYTQAQVGSNGRIMFGTGNALYVASVVGATTGVPFGGMWTDMVPSAAVPVLISAPTPTTFRADWVNVPFFGTAISTTWGIELDAAAMTFKIDGLAGIPPGAPSTVPGGAFIGLSPGQSGGATDLGPIGYTLGMASGPPAGGMVYDFGIPNTVFLGFTSITYIPQTGVNNYDVLVQ